MRLLICFLAVTLCDCVFAQDPTVPSPQILERLQSGKASPTVAIGPMVEERVPPPVLKLKAIVMTANDHGTALIEVEGRRVRLQLFRGTNEQLDESEASAQNGLDQVVIQGSTYHVQSFSARSIVLTNHGKTLHVQ